MPSAGIVEAGNLVEAGGKQRLSQETVFWNSPESVTLVTHFTWEMLQEIVSFPSLEAIKQASSGHMDVRRQISLLFPLHDSEGKHRVKYFSQER